MERAQEENERMLKEMLYRDEADDNNPDDSDNNEDNDPDDNEEEEEEDPDDKGGV